ncbi:DMT family transporter [soil metagenome]|jgi:drug/metabolite transporter (DMT)-like permease|nr:DMT family transporter [Acidobacteriota bacterium]
MKDLPIDSNNSFAPHIALLVVQLMFGSAPVLGKAALQTFPSYAIVGFRVGGAALAFYFLQRFRGNLQLDKKIHYLYFVIFSCFGVIFNQLLFFKGLSLTTATNTSLLAVMIPVFAFLISALIGNDKITWRKVLGIIIAACGVIYLINPRGASFSSATTQGDILIILNSFSYAIYVAVSKKLVSYYGALKSIAWLFLFAAVINVPVGLYSLSLVNLSEVSLSAWLAVGAIVLFPTILAYYWNTWALARVEPSIVAVYIYLQPLIGTFLAIFLLGEEWKPRIFLAMALIFAGVYLVTRKRKLNIAEIDFSAN